MVYKLLNLSKSAGYMFDFDVFKSAIKLVLKNELTENKVEYLEKISVNFLCFWKKILFTFYQSSYLPRCSIVAYQCSYLKKCSIVTYQSVVKLFE